MKRILFITGLCLVILYSFTLSAYSQENTDKFTGKYRPVKGSNDPHGFVYLYVMPNHTYAFVFFGGIESGTWKTTEGYFIMQPDTINNERFYMFAKYNEKLKDISIQFDDFTDTKALYSFDNDSYTEIMHPVFNDDPNCFDYPYKITVAADKHRTIQLVSFADTPWYDSPEDSITESVYTFSLDKQFNDFKFIHLDKRKEATDPMISLIGQDKLSIQRELFIRTETWEEIRSTNDKNYLSELSEQIAQPVQEMKFGDTDEDDPNKTWVKSSYPVIPYLKKEVKTVGFDDKNLFDVRCKDADGNEFESKRKIIGG